MISLVQTAAHPRESLEIGCGTGLLTRHLGSTVAVDLNPRAIRKARPRCPYASFVVADAEYLPFKKGSFSIVVCADVLEHLPVAEQAVQEIWGVLSSEGRLVGSVRHSNLLWRRKLQKFITPLEKLEPLHNTYTVRQLSRILNAFPRKLLQPDILHIEIFFDALKARETVLLSEWNKFWVSQSFPRRVLRKLFNIVFASFVLGHIPDTSSLALEVGVGGGSCAKIFQRRGYHVTGVDSSRAALNEASRLGIPLVLCDAIALPFRDKSFGLCYSQGLIEHLKNPVLCIREMRRTSNVAVVSVPMEYSPFDLLRRIFEWLGRSWLWPDELYFRAEDLRDLFASTFPKSWVYSFFGLDLIAVGEGRQAEHTQKEE